MPGTLGKHESERRRRWTKQRATAFTNSELLDQLCNLIITKLSEKEKGSCLLSSGALVRVQPGTPAKLTRATACEKIAGFCHRHPQGRDVSCRREGVEVTTISDALSAYRICAKAEGKSAKTIDWVTVSRYPRSRYRDLAACYARSFVVYPALLGHRVDDEDEHGSAPREPQPVRHKQYGAVDAGDT